MYSRSSLGLAQGWIGHWPDEPPEQLAELKKQDKISIAQAIWLSRVDLFREIGPPHLHGQGGPSAMYGIAVKPLPRPVGRPIERKP